MLRRRRKTRRRGKKNEHLRKRKGQERRDRPRKGDDGVLGEEGKEELMNEDGVMS